MSELKFVRSSDKGQEMNRLIFSRRFATAQPSALPFGYFLENRTTFLNNVANRVKELSLAQQEDKLLQIIKGTGSQLDDALVKVNHPALNTEQAQPVEQTFNLKQMMACSMHLGHATHRLNPKMVPYIFGERAGIHIIDLEKTLACLRVACRAIMDIAANGGSVLFVGTRENIQRLTYEAAVDCGQYYVNLRWFGGTITNRSHVLRDDKLTPDLLVVLDYPKNAKAVVEANKGNIPVMAICDSDCDPSLVTYPIPANDDAFASVELVARTLSLAALEGRKRRSFKSPVVDSAKDFVKRTRPSKQ
jgi:small subunit ribosomal protein S2